MLNHGGREPMWWRNSHIHTLVGPEGNDPSLPD